MVSAYKGHFVFSKNDILTHAPNQIGVYYCGRIDSMGNLVPDYIGRALGQNTSIRSRLLDHFNEGGWYKATHFGYSVCSNGTEARDFERREIKRLNPTYNVQGKPDDSVLWDLISRQR